MRADLHFQGGHFLALGIQLLLVLLNFQGFNLVQHHVERFFHLLQLQVDRVPVSTHRKVARRNAAHGVDQSIQRVHHIAAQVPDDKANRRQHCRNAHSKGKVHCIIQVHISARHIIFQYQAFRFSCQADVMRQLALFGPGTGQQHAVRLGKRQHTVRCLAALPVQVDHRNQPCTIIVHSPHPVLLTGHHIRCPALIIQRFGVHHAAQGLFQVGFLDLGLGGAASLGGGVLAHQNGVRLTVQVKGGDIIARSHSGRKPGVQLIAVQVCLGVALAKAKAVQLLTVQHLAGDIGFLDDKLVFQRAGQQA